MSGGCKRCSLPNSALSNPLTAGFKGPLRGGERKGRGRNGGEREKGTEGTGENTP